MIPIHPGLFLPASAHRKLLNIHTSELLTVMMNRRTYQRVFVAQSAPGRPYFGSPISDLDNSTDPYFQDKRRQSASSDRNEPTSPAAATRVFSPENTLRSSIKLEQVRGNKQLVHAVKFLLASRERVLTLSEQHILAPIIPEAGPSRLVATLDPTPPIVAFNGPSPTCSSVGS